MKKIFFVVGVDKNQDLDLHNPIMSLLEKFFNSEHAHNIKMYAHANNYKMVTDPIYNEVFKDFDENRMLHMFKIEGSDTLIEHFNKYFEEKESLERWKITPYLKFEKAENSGIKPIKWYSDEFKEFMGF